jgi:hypothetical protein
MIDLILTKSNNSIFCNAFVATSIFISEKLFLLYFVFFIDENGDIYNW